MYRLAICDDELLFLKTHRAMAASLLSEAGIAFEITPFTSAPALADSLLKMPNCFDMLMLDILLGAENGVALARALRDTGYRGGILFATSSKDYSLAGYDVYPVHYLIKPIRRSALKEALLRDYRQRFQAPQLNIPVKGGFTAVPIDAVLYIESMARSLIIHLKDRDIVTAMPLKEIMALLPQGAFLQCHKSFLIPLGKIYSFTRSEIALTTGQKLPVGRVFYTHAMTAFIDYMAVK